MWPEVQAADAAVQAAGAAVQANAAKAILAAALVERVVLVELVVLVGNPTQTPFRISSAVPGPQAAATTPSSTSSKAAAANRLDTLLYLSAPRLSRCEKEKARSLSFKRVTQGARCH